MGVIHLELLRAGGDQAEIALRSTSWALCISIWANMSGHAAICSSASHWRRLPVCITI